MRGLAATLLGVLMLAGCAPPGSEPAPPAVGGWRTFQGTCTAAGERHTIDTGPDARASVVDLSGSVLLTGERGLGAGFQARVVAYADGIAAHGIGRAVWTDERGDRIFSELRLAPMAAGKELTGTFTGGTGRWAGIEGEYRLSWSWVVESDSRVQGRTTSLQGRARIPAPREGPR